MVAITLPDGSEREFAAAVTVADVAADIGAGLAKAALAGRVDGKLVDLSHVIDKDAQVAIITGRDAEGVEIIRHSTAHLMAQAVKELYPEAQVTIGPAIENGFYYDFSYSRPFTPEDLKAIEERMDEIVKRNIKIERIEMSRDEAVKFFTDLGEKYKAELIEAIPQGETISLYRQGDFTDLCAGPHVPSTGKVKAFKLTSIAGAYWRGNEKNKMLQRIYGTAFTDKAELDAYLARIEEAKKRDHRKLGRELDLFDIRDEGPGFPFFYPKGMILRNCLEDYWREIHREAGYEEIKTPIMLNRALWERSGHWDHYKENMYTTKIDDMDFAIKPMNCPGGILVYQRKPWSYRDLPIRSGELGLVHRHELSGALHGLMRVRCFTQDDAHIFMTPDQIRDEIKGVYHLIDKVYSTFGFPYTVELSTRPENSIGTDEMWQQATEGLQGALDDLKVPYTINEGDGAFYGPKIDFHLQDCLGRTWQCGTIQLDMNLPERFDLTYTGADGEKHRPVMIHRVVLGSIERFIGILTEHFGGAFPLWLSPVQAKILTITDRSDEMAKALAERLEKEGIRTELDLRNEKIGFKVREAQMMKIPYMLVLGDKEVEQNVVNVRTRKGETIGNMTIDDLVAKLKHEIETKAVD